MSLRSVTAVLSSLVFLVAFPSSCLAQKEMPAGFVDVSDLVPTLVVDLRYMTNNNFVGKPIDGYLKSRCILTIEAATALRHVQEEIATFGLGLKVFDAYRPQRAVDHFLRWSQDNADQQTKMTFYPEVAKQDLFREGYIARRSSHSRGSTVDLTLISLKQNKTSQEINMGTPFDYFGQQSWVDSSEVTPQQRANRLLLREMMNKHGFRPYDKEWWHFTLADEPYPKTYFNFPVE